MRSPITQSGRPGPVTTVLDGDSRTVSNRLPFVSGRNAEAAAQARDAGLLAKADQVQAAYAGERAGGVGELAGDLEARCLRVAGAVAALDHVRGNADPGDALVDEAERARRPHEADRGQDRRAVGKPLLPRLDHEVHERIDVEDDLQLQEACPGAHLLERTVDSMIEGRRL